MSKSYNVSVNQNFNFEVTEEEITALNTVGLNAGEFHLIHENTGYKTKISEADFHNKAYSVVVNNTTYKVSIANELDKLIKEMGFEIGKTKVVNAIKAPMPGLILEINVTVGQEVNEGDNLLILEAMKMENSFDSPRSGIIKSIAVTKGQAVEKGQLLVEFES